MKLQKIIRLFFVPALAALLLSACNGPLFSLFPHESDAQKPRRFVLSSEKTGTAAALPQITFTRITIPSYLDIPQIVTRNGNTISRDERNRWAEPLARAAARELVFRTALEAAKRNLSATDKQVGVTFERFDGAFGGDVELTAVYTLSTPKSEATDPVSRIFKTRIPVAAPNDADAYVRALSDALDALAQDIAAALSAAE